VGSNNRYRISRTETSATFDAHLTRLRPSPHKTYGLVSLESKVADGQGAGRGYHEMDRSIVFEIEKVLEVTNKAALVSFLGKADGSRARNLRNSGWAIFWLTSWIVAHRRLFQPPKLRACASPCPRQRWRDWKGRAHMTDSSGPTSRVHGWISVQPANRTLLREIAYCYATFSPKHFTMAAST
jgi:hypothetical protein